MLFHHVSLKIDLRTKHDEFLRLAGRIRTWVVRALEMLFLRRRLDADDHIWRKG